MTKNTVNSSSRKGAVPQRILSHLQVLHFCLCLKIFTLGLTLKANIVLQGGVGRDVNNKMFACYHASL
jgi:hypothetical protein